MSIIFIIHYKNRTPLFLASFVPMLSRRRDIYFKTTEIQSIFSLNASKIQARTGFIKNWERHFLGKKSLSPPKQ